MVSLGYPINEAANEKSSPNTYPVGRIMRLRPDNQPCGTSWRVHAPHGTMGLDFKETNLTASVKNAIRDDIAYSMSLIAASNVTFEVSAPNTNHTGVRESVSVR